MAQSLVSNYIHITFSTKKRQKLIDFQIEKELYSYLGGICMNLECNPVMVGGHLDHVHILCTLSKKLPLTVLVEKLKANSSKWIKSKGKQYQNFYWQSGYGAFSVSSKQVEMLTKYIKKQKEHHQNMSFLEEFVLILKKHKVEYNPDYIID